MARGQKAKQKELTPEERLQNALVPKEEWPYELPKGWNWVYLIPGAAECLDGFRKPVNASERAERIGNIPYYGATGQVGYIDDYLTDEPLVLVGEDGAPFLDPFKEKAYLITGKAWVNNHAHILRSYYGDAGNRFLMHFLNVFDYRGYVNGTTRLKLTQSSMQTIPVPYPSKEVQEELVYFIDSELQCLDEAKDKIQSVIDSSEERKQSILHKAFTGALTDNWRHEHGISKTTWQNMKLKDACDGLKYGTSSKSGKIGIVPVIRMGNLQHGEIDWDNLVYSNDAEDNEKYLLKTGDVLFNRTNSPEWVGKTSIYRGERPAIYAGYLVKLDYKPELLLGEYLNFVMNSPEAKTYCNAVKTDGVNQSNISAKKIGEFIIPVPSINEQNEIVRILDRLSDSEKVAKKNASAALDQLEKTKKSILSKAFRGELIR